VTVDVEPFVLPAEFFALRGVRQSGENQWRACCPAHDDRDPSLAFGVDGGRILVWCHGGCSYESVLDAMGLTAADLFVGAQPERSAKPKVLASYVYENADRRALYRLNRLDRPRQRFSSEHLDGSGRWVPTRGGYPPMLYRLPDLLALDSAEGIWCVEGERDAETLWSMGIAGTAVPSNSWAKADLSVLAGRNLVVVCDADPAGLSHGRSRAAAVRAVGGVLPDNAVLVPRIDGLAQPDLTDAYNHFAATVGRDHPDFESHVLMSLVPVSQWSGPRTLDQRMAGRYAYVPSEVLGCGRLAENIYIRLSMLSAGSGEAKATTQELADHLGAGRNQVTDAIRDLEEAGVIAKTRRSWYELPAEVKLRDRPW